MNIKPQFRPLQPVQAVENAGKNLNFETDYGPVQRESKSRIGGIGFQVM